MSPRRHPTSFRPLAALGLSLALVGSSCVFGDDDTAETVRSASLGPAALESGLPDTEPVRGGQVVYGLEAESAGGWCLPEAQLAISGLQVVRSLYDHLVVPDGDGGYSPSLARTVTADETATTWTITLRPDVTFHDGTTLDATVVKNNLDAFRGEYEGRSSLLLAFVFRNVDEVTVVNELTVRVTTKVPWVAFPAALYSSGRVGITAQAQLDADPEECQTEPIGTGPFEFVSWSPGDNLKVRRNPAYWQIAPDGEPYPYLDAIEFRPVPNNDERMAALQQGELNMMHTSTMSDMAENLTELRDEGAINLLVSEEQTETAYLMFNTSREPLDDVEVRRAVAHAVDRRTANDRNNKGFGTIADGPFAPGVLGYLDDPGHPDFDPDAARDAVAAMEEAGQRTELDLMTTTGPAAVRQAGIVKRMLEDVGFTINLVVVAESELVSEVIAGNFDITAFRNQPGEDPDANYNWWYGESNPINFGRFNDAEINEHLDTGRSATDPDERREAYEAINRRFSEQVYNVYLWYSTWAVAEADNVHGILGPPLPDRDDEPTGRIVTGHPVHGIWIVPR